MFISFICAVKCGTWFGLFVKKRAKR